MALTRDRNVDDVNRGLRVETIWGTQDEDEVTMGIADATSIYAMLSDLSAQPGAYVMREAWSNAYDATRRAGKPYAPVEIEIDNYASEDTIAGKLNKLADTRPHIRVTDHGCGMSPDDVRELFLQYGGSDKRGETESVGSKGLGSKAPLAIADTFVVTTTKDGTTTTAVVEKRAGAANAARVTSEFTGAANGTCVDVPVMTADVLRQARQMADSIVRHVTDVPVSLNGEVRETTLPEEVGAEGCGYVYVGTLDVTTADGPMALRAWEKDERSSYSHRFTNSSFPHLAKPEDWELYALIAGVTYPLNSGRHSSEPKVLVEIEPGWLDFTPSRDEIKANEARDELVEQIRRAWSALDHADALMRWLANQGPKAFAGTCSRLGIGKPQRGGYSYGYRSSSYAYAEHGVLHVCEGRRDMEMLVEDVEGLCPNVTWLFADGARTPTFVGVWRDVHSRAHLSLCGKDIPANQVSKLTLDALSSKYQRTPQAFARETSQEQNSFWVCSMPSHSEADTEYERRLRRLEDLKTLMRALASWHSLNRPLSGSASATGVGYPTLTLMLDYGEDDVTEGVEAYLGKHRSTSLEDVCADARRARKASRTERVARAKPDPRTSTDWKSLSCSVAEIPDAANFDERQMLQLMAVKSTYRWQQLSDCDTSVQRLWKNDTSMRSAARGPADAPLRNVALVLCDHNAAGSYTDLTTSLAAVIALGRLHGVDVVPPEVDRVCMSTSHTPLKREVDSAKLNGAVVLADFRTNVTVLEEGVLADRDCEAHLAGMNICVTQRMLCGDDDVFAARWATMTRQGDYATGTEMRWTTAAKVCLDAVDETSDDELRTMFVEPMRSLFAESGNTDNDRTWAPWRTMAKKDSRLAPNKTQWSEVRPDTSFVTIKDLSDDAEALHAAQRRAIEASSAAMRPICAMLGASNGYAKVTDERRREFAHLFADAFATGLRERLASANATA